MYERRHNLNGFVLISRFQRQSNQVSDQRQQYLPFGTDVSHEAYSNNAAG